MSKEQRATTPDLFQVSLRHFSQPVASVASELLFWSQCGEHKLRGREGFYKEDADLVQAIGKDASSIRRALARICAKVGEDRPEALFEIAHGPKPGQRSGQVRWLFRKPRGDELIGEALLLAQARQEKRQRSATKRSGKAPPVGRIRPHRSAQNERTLSIQMDSSESHSESLSSAEAERETESYEEKGFPEGIERFASFWKTACEECNEPTLAWRPSEVRRWSSKLSEFIQEMGVAQMSDEDVMARLRVLVRDFELIKERMGRAFERYNTDGLHIESFVRYSTKLWLATEKIVEEERKASKFKASRPLVKDLSEYKI
jgi:hypothetical protein